MAPGLIPEFVRNLNARTKSRQIGKRGGGDTGFHAGFVPGGPIGKRSLLMRYGMLVCCVAMMLSIAG